MQKYKLHRKLIIVKCDYCGCDVEKPISEVKRNKKLNRHLFCSRSCSMKFCQLHRTQKMIEYSNSVENKDRLLKLNSKENYNNKHPYHEFSYYLHNCKKRFKECTITLEDIHNQWKKQNGVCPYSGIKLELITYTKNKHNIIFNASLDRIDSSKGYVPDNIQFVSTAINYMKNTMSDSDTKFLCKRISENFYSGRTISSSNK